MGSTSPNSGSIAAGKQPKGKQPPGSKGIDSSKQQAASMPTSDVLPSSGKSSNDAPTATPATATMARGVEHSTAADDQGSTPSFATGAAVLSSAQTPEAGDASAVPSSQGIDRQQYQAYVLWPPACLDGHRSWLDARLRERRRMLAVGWKLQLVRPTFVELLSTSAEQ